VKANKLSALLVAGVPLVYAACGGDNLTLPGEGEPAHITLMAGSDGQSARVGAQLPNPLVVKVTDTQDRPVAGATVNFTFDDPTAGGLAEPGSGTTDGNGEASSRITLGSRVGPMTGHATVPVPEGTVPVTTAFTATAVPASANGIAAVSGDGQTGQVGAPLGAPLVVRVTDGFGNPIAGITVEWSVTGGGSVSPATTQTDANGQASVTRTLGNTAGEQTTLATTSENLAGSPVTFTHQANAGSASRVEIVSGNGQSAQTGSQVPEELVVRVLDASNNPIPGRAVEWVIGEGGGTATPGRSNTDNQGHARTRWTLGPTPGRNTLNAVVSGVGEGRVEFTATGTAANSAPTAAFSVDFCDGLTCQFSDRSRDTDGTITKWEWDFGDGSTASEQDPSHTYSVAGTYTVTLRVTDDDGATDDAGVQVDPNSPPDAMDDSYTTPGLGQPLNVAAPGVLQNDSDPDAGATLSATLKTNPSHGSVTLQSDGSFEYRPNLGAVGPDTFTYTATDNKSAVDDATVTITITP
jgi:PKD repeat protein